MSPLRFELNFDDFDMIPLIELDLFGDILPECINDLMFHLSIDYIEHTC